MLSRTKVLDQLQEMELAKKLKIRTLSDEERQSLVDFVMHALGAPEEYEEELHELSVENLLVEALSIRETLDDLETENQAVDRGEIPYGVRTAHSARA